MAKIRCTLFFVDGSYGWSESLYYRPDTTIEAAHSRAIVLAGLRAKLMGTGCVLMEVRSSNDFILRDSLVDTLNLFDNHPINWTITVAVPSASDRPYSSILVRMEGTAQYRKATYLRGCPDAIIVNPIGPVRPAAWQTAFNDWKAELIANWDFKVVNREDAVQPFRTVTGFAYIILDNVYRLTSVGHGYLPFDNIRVWDFKGTEMPRGDFVVKAVTADTVDLTPKFPITAAMEVKKLGKMQKNVFKFASISNVNIRKQTHRNTGRPFDSPRGRRRIRR